MAEKIGDRLLVAGRTNVGRVRSLNEDTFHIDTTANLLLVADGMGGHDAGEIASTETVASICQHLRKFLDSPADEDTKKNAGNTTEPSEDAITTMLSDTFQDEPTLNDLPNPVINVVLEAIALANAELNARNDDKGYSEGAGMGSTVVGMWIPDFSEKPIVFHVGDSRLYLLHNGQINQITLDHSLYQQWVNLDAQGIPPTRNILLQAMGPSHHVTPDVCFLTVEQGDVLLLCSDGLSGMVTDKKIQQTLQTVSSKNLDEICDRLITMAMDGGGRDNITVIIGCFI